MDGWRYGAASGRRCGDSTGRATAARGPCSPQPSRGADVAAVSPSPGADVAGLSPVPVQMWQRCAQSRRRCGRGEPQSRRRCRRAHLVAKPQEGRALPSLDLVRCVHIQHVLPDGAALETTSACNNPTIQQCNNATMQRAGLLTADAQARCVHACVRAIGPIGPMGDCREGFHQSESLPRCAACRRRSAAGLSRLRGPEPARPVRSRGTCVRQPSPGADVGAVSPGPRPSLDCTRRLLLLSDDTQAMRRLRGGVHAALRVGRVCACTGCAPAPLTPIH